MKISCIVAKIYEFYKLIHDLEIVKMLELFSMTFPPFLCLQEFSKVTGVLDFNFCIKCLPEQYSREKIYT
jgi:proteasome assembly chaperone (PAC2) family protein